MKSKQTLSESKGGQSYSKMEKHDKAVLALSVFFSVVGAAYRARMSSSGLPKSCEVGPSHLGGVRLCWRINRFTVLDVESMHVCHSCARSPCWGGDMHASDTEADLKLITLHADLTAPKACDPVPAPMSEWECGT